MGEEEKKPEEKMEEKKPAEEAKKPEEKKEEAKPAADAAAAAAEEKKDDKKTEGGKESKDETPPPPQEIVLKVFMHCEGCARKVRRCLKGFDGVEDVTTDCKTSKVVVKGEKADPLKVLARVQRKSHRQVELISPIPKPAAAAEDKKTEEKPKPEEKKEEPQVVSVVLKVFMHCEHCAMEIKKRILRMKGVESAEPDLKSSEVTVKGVFEPAKLVEYVNKRTGKHAVIVKQDPEKKDNKDEEKKGEESKDEKKGGEGGGEGDKEKKGGDAPAEEKKEGAAAAGGGEGEAKGDAAPPSEEAAFVELKKNEYLFYPQRPAMDLYAYHPYAAFNYPPPQMFSDENPNACSVM